MKINDCEKTKQGTPQETTPKKEHKGNRGTRQHNVILQTIYLSQNSFYTLTIGVRFLQKCAYLIMCAWPRWQTLMDSSAASPHPADRSSFTLGQANLYTQQHRHHRTLLSHHAAHLSRQTASERHGGQVTEVIVSKWPLCNGHKLLTLQRGTVSLFIDRTKRRMKGCSQVIIKNLKGRLWITFKERMVLQEEELGTV